MQKQGHGKNGEEIIKQIKEVPPFLSHCISVSEMEGIEESFDEASITTEHKHKTV